MLIVSTASFSCFSGWGASSLVDPDPLTGKNVRMVLKSSSVTCFNFEASIDLPGGALFLLTSYSEANESFRFSITKYEGESSVVTGRLRDTASDSCSEVSKDPLDAFLAEKSIERDLGCATRWEIPCSMPPRFKAGDDGLGETEGEKLGGIEGDGERAGMELRAGVKRLAGTPVSLDIPGTTRDGRGAGVGGNDKGI